MPTDFYTYRQDTRAAFGGSPIAYQTALTDLAQGEFMAFDASTKKAVRYIRDGSAGDLLGISRDSQLGLAKLGSSPALTAYAQTEFTIFSTGVHLMLGTVGETYTHGLTVYMGADTQTITTVQGTGGVQVGIVWLPDQPAGLTGAVRVPISIDDFTNIAL